MNLRGLICVVTIILCSSSWAEDWAYSMRPGDDIWSIAGKFCGSAAKASEIAQYNNIADPKLIRPGQRINIPVRWLVFAPASARLVAVIDDVVVQRATTGLQNNSRQRAQDGMLIHMGDRLITSSGTALVEFADKSTLSIAPESHVLFNKLTEFGPAGMVDTHLRFAYGRGKAAVKPQNQGDRFRIQTPEGVAAVRGTEFRVEHNDEGAQAVTYSETLSGAVNFTRDHNPTLLEQGFGITASRSGVVKEALLAAPEWSDPQPLTHPEALLGWQPLAGAKSYIVTWAAQDNPDIILRRLVSHNNEVSVDVPRGEYLLSLRGVAQSGLNGFDNTRAVTVQALAPQGQPVNTTVAGTVNFAWRFPHAADTFQLFIADADNNPVSRIETQANNAEVDLPPGDYTWQVKAAQSALSSPQRFSLRPVTPTNLQVQTQGRQVTVAWTPTPTADGYHLRLVAMDTHTPVDDIRVDSPGATFTVPAHGAYRVELTALETGYASEPTHKEITVYRRPWWLLIFLTPLLAL